jgi:error-prone DNA polymerase
MAHEFEEYRPYTYADIKPPGDDAASTRRAVARQEEASATAPRKLWHSSPGSSGR